ncbi:hypothetical protein BU24DRAFT_417660 [Aaosphaeria arxii CBS 175.79]|uniref:Uncharacterized protein n=1 Tax=Aaosphaeria arxii CBS 175.79 TaxID=1450172 RepID=A0A6A5Y9W5_9PLEO|nr:uncharacterized protein BU24DRAFT_417660 [Aaosphaeria arxii CBS 175.79]KAF2022013.1 hypothetical protein BU24DRAFT_417660 [Aaosphaeria arxii CBS 175.79]
MSPSQERTHTMTCARTTYTVQAKVRSTRSDLYKTSVDELHTQRVWRSCHPLNSPPSLMRQTMPVPDVTCTTGIPMLLTAGCLLLLIPSHLYK